MSTSHLASFHTLKDLQTPATFSLDYQPTKVLILAVLGVHASFGSYHPPLPLHSFRPCQMALLRAIRRPLQERLGSKPWRDLIHPCSPFSYRRTLHTRLFLLSTVCQTFLAGLKKTAERESSARLEKTAGSPGLAATWNTGDDSTAHA